MPLCSLTECMLQLKLADNKYLSHIMVNVLKFRTLYSILFWPKFSFLCSCFLNYFVERQTVLIAPSGAVWSGSALFAYVILSYTLVFKILANLLYYKNIINFVYLTLCFLKEFCFFYVFVPKTLSWVASSAEPEQTSALSAYAHLSGNLMYKFRLNGPVNNISRKECNRKMKRCHSPETVSSETRTFLQNTMRATEGQPY